MGTVCLLLSLPGRKTKYLLQSCQEGEFLFVKNFARKMVCGFCDFGATIFLAGNFAIWYYVGKLKRMRILKGNL